MAEDETGQEHPYDGNDHSTGSQPDEADARPTDPATDQDPDHGEDNSTEADPRPHEAIGHPLRNAYRMGIVTLHGRDRDVEVVLDGASALRLLLLYQQRRAGDSPLADQIDLVTSSARNAWLVADFEELIAISWWPDLPRNSPRTAIDPVVDAA